MKHTAFTTNLLKTLFFLTLLEFYFAHFQEPILILKNLKFFTVYDKRNPSDKEFRYQDTTPRLICLIPGNVCVQDEDIWWSLYFRNDIVPFLSNDPLSILKKCKLTKTSAATTSKKTHKKKKKKKLWNRTFKLVFRYNKSWF